MHITSKINIFLSILIILLLYNNHYIPYSNYFSYNHTYNQILSSGATDTITLLNTANKIIDNNALRSLNTKTQPAFYLYNNSIIPAQDAIGADVGVGVGVGVGVVFDKLSIDYHVTLLLLLENTLIQINTNGGPRAPYMYFINTYKVVYLSFPLQQKVTNAGGCGPSVIMILKHLVGKFDSNFDNLQDILIDYYHLPKTVLMFEYKQAIKDIVDQIIVYL